MGNGADLVPKPHVVPIEQLEVALGAFGYLHHGAGEVFGPGTAASVVIRGYDLNAEGSALVADALDLSVGIRGKDVDRYDDGQAEKTDVFDVLLEVFDAPDNRLDIGFGNAFERGAAVKFECAHRGHQHHEVGCEAMLAALDVGELLCAQVRAKAGLGDCVFGEARTQAGGGDGVAAVRDIGKRAAVDQRRVALQGLHQVGLTGVLEQHRHGAVDR